MDYTIRRGVTQDGPAVLEVFNHFVEHSFAAYYRQPLPPGAFNDWTSIARSGMVHVVEADGRIVGFALLKALLPIRTFDRAGDVGYFILPGHTGRGLGAQLLDRLEDDARSLGIVTLMASVSSLNPGSVAFHVRHGFTECGRWTGVGEKLGQVFDVIWLQKDLQPASE